eukprot:gb/GEZN01000434.1/.p1 GENE.gb/GEZN01000434.1/~~gb/GEZN01000434.1/.p1  ORF type:complete len:1366 (-),score=277.77 gb/GEZN01000434.1/:360-4421(-)
MECLFKVPAEENGAGNVLLRWSPSGQFLAVAGANRKVRVYNRSGEAVASCTMTKALCSIEWNKDSNELAIMPAASSSITLLDAKSQETKEIALPVDKDTVTMMAWSRSSSQLAIGTSKGNLLIYDSAFGGKIPTLGKHSKAIISGAWNSKNQLVLGSEDGFITVNDQTGMLVDNPPSLVFLKGGRPYFIAMGLFTLSPTSFLTSNISADLDHTSIYLRSHEDGTEQVLEVDPKYGTITGYRWIGIARLVVSTQGGFILLVTLHVTTCQLTEAKNMKLFNGCIDFIDYSAGQQKLACAGPSGLKVLDVARWEEVKSEAKTFGTASVAGLCYSADGQVLCIGLSTGAVEAVLASVPLLSATHGSKLLYLAGLRRLALLNAADDGDRDNLDLSMDPEQLALGPHHAAVAHGTKVSVFSLKAESDHAVVAEHVLPCKPSALSLNQSFLAALCEGVVHVLGLDSKSETKVGNGAVTHAYLTEKFLVYSNGSAVFHVSPQGTPISEYKHPEKEGKLTLVYPNQTGLRVALMDEAGKGYVLNPVDGSTQRTPPLADKVDTMLWDNDKDNGAAVLTAFASQGGKELTTFVYQAVSFKGAVVDTVGRTPVSGLTPKLVFDGVVYAQQSSGLLTVTPLSSHDLIHRKAGKGTQAQGKRKEAVEQLLRLWRVGEAFELSLDQKDPALWKQIAAKALSCLEVEVAVSCYRQLGDTPKVMALEAIRDVEDRYLLAGHIHLLEGRFSDAENRFLKSSRRITALNMRRDLRHWEEALKLAGTLEPQAIPVICTEYALETEGKGDWNKAQLLYTRAIESKDCSEADKLLCQGGLARVHLRLGDLPKGMSAATTSNNKALIKECASILKSAAKNVEAAQLYEAAGEVEAAARIYITDKNLALAAPLVAQTTSPQLQILFARAQEEQGKVKEALKAYSDAKDVDSVIRLMLGQAINQPDKALAVAREHSTAEGALMVAGYCKKKRMYKETIEFYIIANRVKDAFELAKVAKEMDVYVNCMGNRLAKSDYEKVALFYEQQNDFENVGKYYALCDQNEKALETLIKGGAIDGAITVVGDAVKAEVPEAQALVQILHDFITGKTTGKIQNLRKILKLYIAMGSHTQSASAALLIARHFQNRGIYRAARDHLVLSHQSLISHRVPVPHEVRRNLLLLHSYLLAQNAIKNKKLLPASRLLLRVAKNVNRFPQHACQILVAATAVTHQAGLHKSAHTLARTLMSSQHKEKIPEKFRTKFLTLARRKPGPEPEEALTPCPCCSFAIPESLLECPSCYNTLPFCAQTGLHMVADDFSYCPSCKFSSLHSAISSGQPCAICNREPNVRMVVKLNPQQVAKYLFDLNNAEAEETGPGSPAP